MSQEFPSIEVIGASRWFGNVVAVNDVSFSIEPGITGLLGPNGAGKSTIINLMAGLLRPSAGTVIIGGRPAWGNPAVYQHLGLVPEREAVYGVLSAKEFIALAARLHRVPDEDRAVLAALESVDLMDVADRRLATFSKGMKQRAKLAAALVHAPGILILDEPFNGLDPRQRHHIMGILRHAAASGCSIVVSSHILHEIELLADRVLVMLSGRLAASGPPREIRRLMTNRPYTFTIASSDNRALAALLVERLSATHLELGDRVLTVRTADYAAFVRGIAPLAATAGIALQEMVPADESLESVFNYLVEGRAP